MKQLFFVLIILVSLTSCIAPKPQDSLRVEGAFLVNNDGNLEPKTPTQVTNLVNANQKNNKDLQPQTHSLREIGDCVSIKKGELFFADFWIDETEATIESTMDQSNGDVNFCVISKNKKRIVVMRNLCDNVSIPSKDVSIEVKDEYNTVKDNKPYKIIVVPTFNEKCEVDGYVVRFDTEGRKNKCPDSKLVKQQEKDLDDCQKGGEKPDFSPPCYKKIKCPEYRMFRICCP